MAVDPPFRIKNMVPGMIMLWYGTEATVPSGWHVCDGTMGTPDLRGRFVRGGGGIYFPGGTGGSASHAHTFTGDSHFHTHAPGKGLTSGVDVNINSTSDPAVGTTNPKTTLPLYIQLCYIMKL